MANDEKEQGFTEAKDKLLFGLFAFQLDKSIDIISSAFQLMVLVCYLMKNTMKKELPFCSERPSKRQKTQWQL